MSNRFNGIKRRWIDLFMQLFNVFALIVGVLRTLKIALGALSLYYALTNTITMWYSTRWLYKYLSVCAACVSLLTIVLLVI